MKATPAPKSGYLSGLDAREVGLTATELGAGRARKGEPIDHGVGVIVHYKIGEYVETGTPLFTVHANGEDDLETAERRLLAAHTISDQPVEAFPLFYRRISSRQVLGTMRSP